MPIKQPNVMNRLSFGALVYVKCISSRRSRLNAYIAVLFVFVLPWHIQEASGKVTSKSNGARSKAKTAPHDWKKCFEGGKIAFEHADYLFARTRFLSAAALAPREVAVQYYLGLSSAYAGDYQTAQQAMARVIVMSPPASDACKNAIQFFKTYQRQIGILEPYPASDNGKLIRWQEKIMPVKVHITQGLQLPAGYSGDDLTTDKYVHLQDMLKKPAFYSGLRMSPYYESQWYGAALGGLQQWQWVLTEGFLRFRLVNSPEQADIVVFWCPSMANSAGKTHYATGGNKVIMQICTKVDDSFPSWIKPTLIANTAAHEFGHAWGLQAHSPNTKDLMSATHESVTLHYSGGIGNMSTGVTANDCATLRALYQIPADLYLSR